MSEDSKEYLLVEEVDEQSLQGETWEPVETQHASLFSNWKRTLILLVLSFSLILNMSLMFEKSKLSKALDVKGRSKYSGLEVETQVVYHGATEYSGDNDTLVDELWDNFSTDAGAIALTYDYAKDNGLIKGNPYPWDNTKAMYYVRAFHDMHCLKRLQRSLSEYHREVPQTLTREHIKHCLDTLRQTIMCSADDTPMPTYPGDRSTGDGQIMECRNWDALVEWSQDPEKETCYNSLDEYRMPKHNLERFAYCPKDSKYFPIMSAYFEKWGHKEVY